MSDSSSRARELAEAFDRAFELPERVAEERGGAALAIRVGADAYLLPLGGLSAVSRCTKLVELPGAPPGQIGLTGLRGGLVGVFSLPALLGYDVAPAKIAWLAMTAGPRSYALGFEVLDGQVTLPQANIVAGPADGRRHVSGLLRLDGEAHARGVLDVPSIVARLEASSAGAG